MCDALKALYGHHGYDFIHLKNLVAHNAEDTFWADAFKRFGGTFIISGDCKIAYKPHEAIAFIENGLVSVFPSENWAKFKLHEKAVLLVYHWPAIADLFKTAEKGTNWRLNLKGDRENISLKPAEFTRLEIPTHVLEEARARRNEKRAFP